MLIQPPSLQKADDAVEGLDLEPPIPDVFDRSKRVKGGLLRFSRSVVVREMTKRRIVESKVRFRSLALYNDSVSCVESLRKRYNNAQPANVWLLGFKSELRVFGIAKALLCRRLVSLFQATEPWEPLGACTHASAALGADVFPIPQPRRTNTACTGESRLIPIDWGIGAHRNHSAATL